MSAPPEVAVSDVISKMLQIEKLAPHCAGGAMTYRLVRYMASSESTYLRAGETLFPEIFLMTFVTAVNDAEKGVNSFTGERVPRTIANMSPLIYGLVRRDIPVIADAVFPPQFATEVKEVYESVKAELAVLQPPPEEAPKRKRASTGR